LGPLALAAAPAAEAASLRVTVENLLPAGGFSLTPFYVAFHDGTFDAFSRGDPASPGVELLAELGDVSGLPGERMAVDPGSTAQVIAQPANGAPPIDPGESGMTTFDLDPTGGEQSFLTFLSMIVPSNDQFIGNGNPLAFPIFDPTGNYLGDQIIDITAAFAYDAGTEVNDRDNGPAFVAGVDATAGADENGVITQGEFSLDQFVGLMTPIGQVTQGLNIVSDLPNTQIARITVSEVAPIPLPASAPLFLAALGGLGWLGRRRRRNA
jgi:hypothetical protein